MVAQQLTSKATNLISNLAINAAGSYLGIDMGTMTVIKTIKDSTIGGGIRRSKKIRKTRKTRKIRKTRKNNMQ